MWEVVTDLSLEMDRRMGNLLDEYGVGLIATSPTDIRIAFSCLEVEDDLEARLRR